MSTENIENPQQEEDLAPPPKKKLHPGAKKNLVVVGIIGGIAVILTAIFSFMGSSAPKQQGPALQGGKGQKEERDVADARYNEMARERERQAFEQAQTTGNSFLGSSVEPDVNQGFTPEDLTITDNVNPALAQTKVKPSINRGDQYANTRGRNGNNGGGYAPPDEYTIQRIEERSQSVAKQMGTIFEQQIPLAHVSVDNRIPPDEIPMQTAMQGNGQMGATMPVAAPAAEPDQTKPPGYQQQLFKSAIATLDKPIQADRDNLVIATVRSGPYEGARLQGTAKRDLDQMRVEFTNMSFGGRSYQVRASGLDESTLSTLVEGNYDGNYLARYVAPFLFTTAGAIAEARGQTDQQVIFGGQGQVVQSVPAPTDQEAIAKGISEGIKTAGKVFSENVKPPTVSAATNSAIAIIWLN